MQAKRGETDDLLPRCFCGQVIKYAVGDQCEDHLVEQFEKWHGRDQSVNTIGKPNPNRPEPSETIAA
jgi:hypothetical protein